MRRWLFLIAVAMALGCSSGSTTLATDLPDPPDAGDAGRE